MNWYRIGVWWVRKFPLKEGDYAGAGVDLDVYKGLCASCQPMIKTMLELRTAKEKSVSMYVIGGLVLLFAGLVIGSFV